MMLEKFSRYRALTHNKKGFSFIEIMVALIIISIVSAFGISVTSTYIDESKIAKAEAEAATVQIALSQYNIDHPEAKITSTSALTTAFSTNGALIKGGYLQKQPHYHNTDGCTYNIRTNGLTGSALNYHVYISGCKFIANGGKIGTYIATNEKASATK
ncbi:type II secretion system protein [Selenomonas montiformis]|uniref:type II secretion system protein n=1 Tax=Selenomonas montiformis TaxID=2652285 RepID=UPI003F8C71AD